jgi:sugar-specific transcriptional regulator TrmB
MQVVNGKEGEIVEMLRDFGLSMYEAKMYFTLLTVGEAKVMTITRKASIPQSKAYDVLDSLREKGFVELSEAERPKRYRARVLEEVADFTIRQRQKELQELERHQEKLNEILRNIAPLHQRYNGLRLFTPSYQRR